MPTTHCAKCGEQVVRAHLQGGGEEVILDPRPRVFLRIHRADRQVEAWLSSEALVEHAGICSARAPAINVQARATAALELPPADPPGDEISVPAALMEWPGLRSFAAMFVLVAAALLIPTALVYQCNPTPLD